MRKYTAYCCALLSLVIGCQTPSGLMSSIPSLRSTRIAKSSSTAAPSGQNSDNNLKIVQARTLVKQGKLDEACYTYSQILASEERADAHHELAVLHDKQGNFLASEPHYEAAMKLTSKNPEIMCDRGYSYLLQGDFDKADEYLRMALSRDPSLTRAHNNLGLVLAQRGKIDGALGEFAAAGCTHAEARTNLSYALMMSGEIDAAKYQLELARRSDDSLPATRELEHAMVQLAGGAPPQPTASNVSQISRVTPLPRSAPVAPSASQVRTTVVAAEPSVAIPGERRVEPATIATTQPTSSQLAATTQLPLVDAKPAVSTVQAGATKELAKVEPSVTKAPQIDIASGLAGVASAEKTEWLPKRTSSQLAESKAPVAVATPKWTPTRQQPTRSAESSSTNDAKVVVGATPKSTAKPAPTQKVPQQHAVVVSDMASDPSAPLSPAELRERLIKSMERPKSPRSGDTVSSPAKPDSRDLAVALSGDLATQPHLHHYETWKPNIETQPAASEAKAPTSVALRQLSHQSPADGNTLPSTRPNVDGGSNPLRDPSSFRFWR